MPGALTALDATSPKKDLGFPLPGKCHLGALGLSGPFRELCRKPSRGPVDRDSSPLSVRAGFECLHSIVRGTIHLALHMLAESVDLFVDVPRWTGGHLNHRRI